MPTASPSHPTAPDSVPGPSPQFGFWPQFPGRDNLHCKRRPATRVQPWRGRQGTKREFFREGWIRAGMECIEVGQGYPCFWERQMPSNKILQKGVLPTTGLWPNIAFLGLVSSTAIPGFLPCTQSHPLSTFGASITPMVESASSLEVKATTAEPETVERTH